MKDKLNFYYIYLKNLLSDVYLTSDLDILLGWIFKVSPILIGVFFIIQLGLGLVAGYAVAIISLLIALAIEKNLDG